MVDIMVDIMEEVVQILALISMYILYFVSI
jgi:hypothetical protein